MKAPRHQAEQGAAVATRARLCASLALFLAGAMLLVWSAPASALLSQGHVFAGTFEGSGAQSFQTPGGVAVDEASGVVYVADPSDGRVELFKPGVGGYEFVGELKVPNAGAIAVDNSSRHRRSLQGRSVRRGGGDRGRSGVRRTQLSLQVHGVWGKNLQEEGVQGQKERKKNSKQNWNGYLALPWTLRAKCGSTGMKKATSAASVTKNRTSCCRRVSKEGVLEQSLLETPCLVEPGFAVGPSDEAFYVAHERETGFGECPEEVEPRPTMVSKLEGSGVASIRSLDRQDATGVALDSGRWRGVRRQRDERRGVRPGRDVHPAVWLGRFERRRRAGDRLDARHRVRRRARARSRCSRAKAPARRRLTA